MSPHSSQARSCSLSLADTRAHTHTLSLLGGSALDQGLRIYAGIIDPELNDVGFIVPGVGDAGDRSFGT